MSRITSVAPTTATLQPGQSVNLVVQVADVPPDQSAQVVFNDSVGTPLTITLTLDKPNLQALIGGTAPLLANQIRATADVGLLELVGTPTNTSATFRYTAP